MIAKNFGYEEFIEDIENNTIPNPENKGAFAQRMINKFILHSIRKGYKRKKRKESVVDIQDDLDSIRIIE